MWNCTWLEDHQRLRRQGLTAALSQCGGSSPCFLSTPHLSEADGLDAAGMQVFSIYYGVARAHLQFYPGRFPLQFVNRNFHLQTFNLQDDPQFKRQGR
jgi:hypothetical protein